MPQSNDSPVPHYLIKLWNLNLNHRPDKYSPLIIPLIRISVSYQQSLNNGQHIHILRKLIAIVGSPNVPVSVKCEVLRYLRHVAINFFTAEHQRDILKSIRQLFNKCFVDTDPIVRKSAFIAYAAVIRAAQHEDLQPDQITDDANVKMELFDFMKKRKNSAKSEERIKFVRDLTLHSIQNKCPGTGAPASDDNLPGCGTNEIRMKEIIERMRSDTRELLELNRKHRLKEDFRKDIASIRQVLDSLK